MMELQITSPENNVDSLGEIHMRHNGEEIIWSGSSYERARFNNLGGLFTQINEYWSRLTPNRQQNIFDVYKKIKTVLDTVTDFNRAHQRLQVLVKDLYELHNIQEIIRLVVMDTQIVMPVSVKECLGPKDSKDLTYLKTDYQELMSLAVYLRPMVPVWSEYIRNFKEHTGNIYKESLAFSLLGSSSAMKVQPMERLSWYIDRNIDGEKTSIAAILGGLGSADLPGWLLALAVVRRLAVGEITAPDGSVNIISNIYNFLVNSLDGLDRRFGGRVAEKHNPNNQMGDDNMSAPENYKIKQEFSLADIDGAIVAMDGMKELIHTAMCVDNTIPPELVVTCVEGVQGIANADFQNAIAGWICKDSSSPRIISHLDYNERSRIYGVAQAILWHWGFYELAAMQTALPILGERAAFYGGQTMSRLSRDVQDTLLAMYPHYHVSSDSRNGRGKSDNPAVPAIEAITPSAVANRWNFKGPAELGEITGFTGSIFVCPPDFKNMIARFLIRLNNYHKV